jgi:Flp pilus assembly protein TadG
MKLGIIGSISNSDGFLGSRCPFSETADQDKPARIRTGGFHPPAAQFMNEREDMGKQRALGSTLHSHRRLPKSPAACLDNNKGQALVEFTLIFILLLIVAWIPADFGLAFMTGQLASNAAREGARIGSATRPFNPSDVVTETCRRLPSALLSDPGAGSGTSCSPVSNARVNVALVAGSGSCNQMVQVTVSGNYNFSFYRLLYLMGVSAGLNSKTITRQTSMRWEHQC